MSLYKKKDSNYLVWNNKRIGSTLSFSNTKELKQMLPSLNMEYKSLGYSESDMYKDLALTLSDTIFKKRQLSFFK